MFLQVWRITLLKFHRKLKVEGKKLSQEFIGTESRILGARSKLYEFLLTPKPGFTPHPLPGRDLLHQTQIRDRSKLLENGSDQIPLLFCNTFRSECLTVNAKDAALRLQKASQFWKLARTKVKKIHGSYRTMTNVTMESFSIA